MPVILSACPRIHGAELTAGRPEPANDHLRYYIRRINIQPGRQHAFNFAPCPGPDQDRLSAIELASSSDAMRIGLNIAIICLPVTGRALRLS